LSDILPAHWETTMSDWQHQAEDIKLRLEQIGIAAKKGTVPDMLVDEVKDAVDFCRTSLWAAQVSASQAHGTDAATLLIEARLHRLAQMAGSMVEDVTVGRLTKKTRGTTECLTQLRDAVTALEGLLGEEKGPKWRKD
jgi:hypothetical protein